jgi:hypothetical protein
MTGKMKIVIGAILFNNNCPAVPFRRGIPTDVHRHRHFMLLYVHFNQVCKMAKQRGLGGYTEIKVERVYPSLLCTKI